MVTAELRDVVRSKLAADFTLVYQDEFVEDLPANPELLEPLVASRESSISLDIIACVGIKALV